ncbi:uncharacterized protein LOC128157869 isoform X2 [Crassostrea angulata]|uniref:uncharacterized protein LOC128157869 isoform X2 n=1 Tax=Magallana angulata TaxID=2784310 RepID=UPI0022B1827B|nr:uncharacterized protein LOC128157869 isoform X2 [Crassostrea angulata]
MTLVYKMCAAKKFIFITVLVLSDLLPTSTKTVSAGPICTHHWKKDFGFKINESVGASLKKLPDILKGFLDVENQDDLETDLKVPINICISSVDCRLYTVLDKNNTNSLTFCVVTKKVKKCSAFTCTCPDTRNRRSIDTPNGQDRTNSDSIFKLTNPICKFKFIYDERICDTAQTDVTFTENNSFDNQVKYTTTMDNFLKEDHIKVEEGNTTWLYFLIFAIGVGVGTVIGSLATFIWFKRKYLLPKTSSEVNGTYNKENITTVIHDVTEYSEIPEDSKTTCYEPIEDFQHHHQESLRNATHSEFCASPSLVTHVEMCEYSFKSEDQKKEEQVQHVVPLQNRNIEKNRENTMECLCVVGAINHSPKEECEIMTHTAQEDNINSKSVYFELSAASENEKLLVPECTNYHSEYQDKKADRMETKHVNKEENAASKCEKGDDQPTENVYFELGKTDDCLSSIMKTKTT